MKRYQNIQILRVLSCLGVFVTHLAPRMGARGTAAKIANFGASGVYLFFAISGFLACSTKLSADIKSGAEKGNALFAYYMKRILKILPLYYAVVFYNILLHTFLLQDVPADPDGLYWVRYFFLTNAFIPAPDNFWGNLTATWTISLFMVFYLLVPVFNGVMKWARRFPKKGSLYAAIFLYAGALTLRYVWIAAGLSSYMMIFYYLHFFLLGMLIRQLAEAFGGRKAAGIFSVGAAAAWVILHFSGIGNDEFTCWSWVFALILLLTLSFTWKKENVLSKAVTILDQHSFAIYLVHAVVIDGIGLLQGKIALPAIAVLVIAVGLTAAGAYAAHLLIEKPVEKLGRRLVTALRI